MAVIVHCGCGTALEAQEEWRGRMVECARCGQLVAVPAAGEEAAAGDQGSLWDEELAAGLTAPTAGPPTQRAPFGNTAERAWGMAESPFQPHRSAHDSARRPVSQGKGIRGFFRRLFYVKKRIFQWAEPTWCRQRLRGEVGLRLSMIAGIWGFLTGALFIPSHRNPGGAGRAAPDRGTGCAEGREGQEPQGAPAQRSCQSPFRRRSHRAASRDSRPGRCAGGGCFRRRK